MVLAVLVFGLNLRPTEHPGLTEDNSPFVDAWEFSARTEYGFPFTGVRHFSEQDAQRFSLPRWQPDLFGVVMNAMVYGLVAAVGVALHALKRRVLRVRSSNER